MKSLFLSTLFLSLSLTAQTNYSTNDGNTPPGTFESKDTRPSRPQTTNAEAQDASPMSSESGIMNSSGVTTDQMNTSPNTPPMTDEEVIDDSTLSRGPIKNPTNPAEIQAQDEENALDYSTTPEKDKKKKQKKNKK